MKRYITAAILGLALFGCTEKKQNKDAILDEVIKVHDKVMSADAKLMRNKMQLDTLLQKTNLTVKDTAAMIRARLVAADNAMENWMHKFDPDYKGKSDDETIAYLNDQKEQITAIDSAINKAVSEAGIYISKLKIK